MKIDNVFVWWRTKKGLSQMGAASLLGVSQASVSRWETGETFPTGLQLRAFEGALKDLNDKHVFAAFEALLASKNNTNAKGR